MLETGIKVIDLLEPYVQGGKIGMFGGAGVGKTVIIQEMIRRQAPAARRRVGVRRRGGAHPRGQRPVPGDDRVRRARQHRARCSARWTSRPACGCASRCRALTMAEYFRDVERKDVLLFVDNIFRFTQAGSEVSTLLGRMPSRSGLPADARGRDGRAAGADHVDEGPFDHVAAGDLRARRRHHRPGAAHGVRAPGRDDRAVARHRVARASIRPSTRSTRRQPDPRPALRRRGALRRRAARAGDPAAQQGPAGHHRDPRHRRALRGGQGHRVSRAARSSGSCPSRSSSPSSSPASRASTCRSTRRSPRSRASARASTTTCPSRPSSWSAASRRPRSRQDRWRARSA